MRILKNYRLPEETIDKLEKLQYESGKTATDIIDSLIQYVHSELKAAQTGEEHDNMVIAQILGIKIRKPKALVKTAS